MEIFTYLREMLSGPAVFLDVLGTSITEELCRARSFVRTEACVFNFFSKVAVRTQRTRPIRKAGTLGIVKKKPPKRWNVSQRAKEPGAMRSNPRAMTQSAAPYFTRLLDW